MPETQRFVVVLPDNITPMSFGRTPRKVHTVPLFGAIPSDMPAV